MFNALTVFLICSKSTAVQNRFHDQLEVFPLLHSQASEIAALRARPEAVEGKSPTITSSPVIIATTPTSLPQVAAAGSTIGHDSETASFAPKIISRCGFYGVPLIPDIRAGKFLLTISLHISLTDRRVVKVVVNVAMLRQQHADILGACNEIDSIFSGTSNDAHPRLGAARAHLARLILRYYEVEERELYGVLRAHNLTRQIPGYDEIASETRELHLQYSAFVSEWSMAAVMDDWNGYRSEARRLSRSLRMLLSRKERELFPIAQKLLETTFIKARVRANFL